jgi:hypothetical protein
MRISLCMKLLFATALATACGRQDSPTTVNPPVQVTQPTTSGPRFSGGYVSTYIECVVTVWTTGPMANCGSGSQPYYSDGPRSSLITQQCVVACVEPLAPTYDASHGWWAVKLRVHNKSSQAFGTFDGVTPSSWKTSVVLVEPPRSVSGLGVVSVVGPTARISAHPSLPPNTLYRTYPGIIQPYGASDYLPWTFNVPRSVTRFAFRVAVVADVEPRIKISELMPGLKSATASAGMILEMDNVGTASIGVRTTLVIVDSIRETHSVVVATMRMTDEWQPRERRIVASADHRSVLFTPIYGLFPTQYRIDNTKSHRIRVRVGSRTGKVLDELWVDPNFRLAGSGFERTYSDYSNTVTKFYYPAWVSVTTPVSTRCAGSLTCPVLTGSPGKANSR